MEAHGEGSRRLGLVAALLRVAVGLDAEGISWDPSKRVFAPGLGSSVSMTEASMVARVGEAGWLVRRLQTWCSGARALDGSSGLVLQALAEAVAAELAEYHRLISSLEGQLRAGATAALRATASASSSAAEVRARLAEAPSVRSVCVWLEAPIELLRTLAGVVDATEGLDGGILASAVWRQGQHGSPTVRALVRRLLQRATAPLLGQLRRWCLEGELQDEFGEFFVREDVSVGMDALWQRRFRMHQPQRPVFFSPSLCDQAVLVGKSIQFLRAACDDSAWVLSDQLHAHHLPEAAAAPSSAAAASSARDHAGPRRATAAVDRAMRDKQAAAARSGDVGRTLGDLGSARGWRSAFLFEERGLGVTLAAQQVGTSSTSDAAVPGTGASRNDQTSDGGVSPGLSALEALVNRLARRVSSRVVSVMMGRYRLRGHLASLRRFMLLGQGDFVQELMRAASEHLSKPATEQTAHVLLGMLEGAIRSSSAQDEDREFLDRLNVCLLPATAGDKGWDVFCLTYDVSAPLTAVLHPLAVAAYERIFAFLWRVKRAEWALSTSWCAQAAATHTLSRYRELASLLHRAHLLRADMGSFVSTLSSYCMFEVLEASWKQLCDALSRADTLPAVISAHDEYLRSVARKALLTGGKAEREVAPLLRELLDWALQFARMQTHMFGALTTVHEAMDAEAKEDADDEEDERAAADLAMGGAADGSTAPGAGGTAAGATASRGGPSRRGGGGGGSRRRAQQASAGLRPLLALTEAQLQERRRSRERRRLRRRRELRTQAGGFAAQLHTLARRYRGSMLRLLASLDTLGAEPAGPAGASSPGASGGGIEELRFLFFRFDFNEFYLAKFEEPGALAALGTSTVLVPDDGV